MSMRFRYSRLRTAQPAWPLGGQSERPRPLVLVSIIGPAATAVERGGLDTGADDTVFEERVATRIGIDLTGAPTGSNTSVGGTTVAVRYAQVNLRLTDGHEFRAWTAWVGFTPTPLDRGLLGFAGCLQFFSAHFHGDREEVELAVNGLYPGT